MPRILLVCTGNTCRSPLAEVILKDLQPDWEVASAGVSPVVGQAASRGSLEVARARGFDLSRHRAQAVNAQLLGQADQVWCMTEAHRQSLLLRYPEFRAKLLTLAPFDIADPVGQSLEVYRECADQIEAALRLRLVCNE
jgi:protein-tyrosine-phosphatase